MTSERWERVKEVVANAVEQPPDERAGFISAACADDTALQREVESIVNQSDANLELCAEQMSGPLVRSDVLIGTRIGSYEIIREIGRGGMGAVYLARRADAAFEKEAAIKLLKRGTDTDEVLRRFQSERQILARLEHPNIARLLDAGTTDDGLPYFVMEYVDGEPITDFCTKRNLGTHERVELMRQVCGAVHFAHQNLVVHRDLKPRNILVTAEAFPKLLDFGIAKLLSADGDAAQLTIESGQRLTAGYASPEQVRGEPVTTASDVYSLGALLYELLGGSPPHRFETGNPSLTELFRVIVEREPARLSAIATDLETIVRKALSKEPQRRYSGASALAEDLTRYLEGRPVRAQPATLRYRTSRFVRRNKFAVAAGMALLAAVMSGVVATLWQASEAKKQAALAQRRFHDVRKLAHAVVFDYHDAISGLPGSTAVRERLVKDALEYLDNLSREAANDRGLLRELASAYAKVGQIQGNSYYANLGDTEGALKSYRASLALREKLLTASPDDVEVQHETADSHEGVGDVLLTRGDLRVVLENYERALTLRAGLGRARPEDIRSALALALLYLKMGDVRGGEAYANLGDLEGALASYRRGEEILEPLVAAHPGNLELPSELATLLTRTSMLTLVTGDAPGALRMARRAVELDQQVVQADPNDQSSQAALLDGQAYLHYALIDNELLPEAIEQSRACLIADEKLLAADPKNINVRRGVGVDHNTLGRDLLAAGNTAEAIEHHHIALAISKELLASDPNNEENKFDLAFTLRQLGRAQAAHGEHVAALANLRQALAQREARMAADSANARAREDVAGIYQDIGNSLARTNDHAGALEAFAKAIPLAEDLSRQSPTHARRKARLAEMHSDAGRIRLELSRSTESPQNSKSRAREHLSRSLVLWRELQERKALIPANARKLRETETALAECEASSAR